MLISISCALIGHIRNNVSDLIGVKTTKGKECCSNVSSRLWGGALRDETKNGCELLSDMSDLEIDGFPDCNMEWERLGRLSTNVAPAW